MNIEINVEQFAQDIKAGKSIGGIVGVHFSFYKHSYSHKMLYSNS